ncbi:GMC family oxidoreductase N-terminal domain-containing protein [Gymnodinialimonas sp. 57CJ19]|uniref:GMC family oxidoreductase n=1 Tax=Gymnodinialimonas sp. 57CJ19 TaxID=3138498 RepID=UPI0031343B9E
MNKATESEADYIVVGAGAAGCVVAARLSEDARKRVILIEAGGSDRNPLIAIPGANVVTGTDPALNWNFETEPEPALDGRRLYMSQGRVMGGSASINGMMFLRGRAVDFDGWRADGCPGWGASDVAPWFRKLEDHPYGQDPQHGSGGPMRISRGAATAPICDLFLEAAEASGIARVEDFVQAGHEAAGYADLSIDQGRRVSTATAYLGRARSRPNLRVITKAHVTRIVIEGKRAVGVALRRGANEEIFRCNAEVIVAGGAINSPALLLRSGIGDPSALSGVDVVHDLPGVGRNYQNHPMYKMMFTTNAPLTAYSHARPLGAIRAGLSYITGRRGVLASGLFPVAGYFDAVPGQPETLLQICMAPALIIRRKPGVLGVLPKQHGFSVLLYQGVPFSRGRVRLKSDDPMAAPAIEAGVFSDARDLEILAQGALRIRAIMDAPPIRDVIGAEIAPGPIADSLEAIKSDISANISANYHVAGTCRMGLGRDAVVDTRLRVHGLDGLRVIDASIMPTVVRANTYATTVMIAERGAAFIAEDAR